MRPCICSTLTYDSLVGATVASERLVSTRNALLQEDAHAVALGLADRDDAALFAIYDGHGGKEVAKFAAVHMVRGASDPLDVQLSKRTAAAAAHNSWERRAYSIAYSTACLAQPRCLGGGRAPPSVHNLLCDRAKACTKPGCLMWYWRHSLRACN